VEIPPTPLEKRGLFIASGGIWVNVKYFEIFVEVVWW